MTPTNLLVSVSTALAVAWQSPTATRPEPLVEVRAVAGADGDFLQATHVRIRGSQREIGRELARFASERHRFEPAAAREPKETRAQREYFASIYPAQLERMRGVAELFELDLDGDAYELGSVTYGLAGAGCTVVYHPPATTELGQGVLSRNFDFTTGTADGRVPASREAAMCSSPCVLELYPDRGYATLCVVAFDLLGVVDGVNSEGLTIALLADDELSATGQARPTPGVHAGFDVLEIGRFVLETCADVDEARAALRAAKLYYSFIPCHYLVADRHGRSFVWENAVDLRGGHALDGGGEAQISTNYLQHLHPDPAALPDDANELGLFGRERTLRSCLERQGKLSLEEIRANSVRVSARQPVPAGSPPGRTLWHALYFPEERRMEVDFYLGEERGADGAPAIRRSGYLSFRLEQP